MRDDSIAAAQTSRLARPQRPVCVVGFHGSVLGIGEAARHLAAALRLAGAEVVEWDISALFGHDVRLDSQAPPTPPAEAFEDEPTLPLEAPAAPDDDPRPPLERPLP